MNLMSKVNKSKVKTLSNLIKKCDKTPFKGVFEDSNKWCFCDGIIAFALDNKVLGVPEVGKSLDVVHIIDNVASECTQEITIDSMQLEELTALNKAKHKSEGITPYKIDVNGLLIAFNPEYYKIMLNVLGANCQVFVNPTNAREPLYFKGEAGTGILLPMLLPKE